MSVPSETSYTLHLPEHNFEGPLDLLLHLIERAELDITKVSLAKVTAEYLQYLTVMQRAHVGELADFIVVASKLLFIKSRLLLPQSPPGLPEEELEEDVGDELVRQLLAYKHFKQVALQLREREGEGLRSYQRIAPRPKLEKRLDFSHVSLQDLAEIVRRILEERRRAPVGTVLAPLVFTIKDKMLELQERLELGERFSFRGWLRRMATRIEIIVSFLAVLELLKQRKLAVVQNERFGDIFIEPALDAPEPTYAEVEPLISFIEPTQSSDQ
jgi:segregation and condensation protein A